MLILSEVVYKAGIEVLVLGALFVGAAAVAYDGYQKARNAARDAANGARGVLAQVRASSWPRRIIFGQTRVGGIEAYVATSGTDNEYLHYILMWSEGPCNNVAKIYFDGTEVTFSGNDATGDYAGLVHHQFTYGHVPQDAIADAVAEVPGWQDSDRLYGICYSWIRLKYDEAAFPNGVPEISALITGYAAIRDPRSAYKTYTNNVALCWSEYMSISKKGPGIDPFLNIDNTDLITAANVCDESVSLAIGGTESRYTFNGAIRLDDPVEDIINRFRTAMAGTITFIGGRWRVFAGEYRTPTFELDESNMLKPIKIKRAQDRRKRFNTVRGVYISPDNDFNITDFPAFSSQDFIDEDGEVIYDDLDLVDTNSLSMARRIAKIHMMKARFSTQIEIVCDIEALRMHPGLNFFFTNTYLNFSSTPFECLSWDLVIAESAVEITMSGRLTDPIIYDWSTAEDRTDDAALPTASGVSTPSPGFGGDPNAVVGGISYTEI